LATVKLDLIQVRLVFFVAPRSEIERWNSTEGGTQRKFYLSNLTVRDIFIRKRNGFIDGYMCTVCILRGLKFPNREKADSCRESWTVLTILNLKFSPNFLLRQTSNPCLVLQNIDFFSVFSFSGELDRVSLATSPVRSKIEFEG